LGFVQLVQKYEKRDMPHLDWLDKMTFAEIEKVHAVSSTSSDSPEA